MLRRDRAAHSPASIRLHQCVERSERVEEVVDVLPGLLLVDVKGIGESDDEGGAIGLSQETMPQGGSGPVYRQIATAAQVQNHDLIVEFAPFEVFGGQPPARPLYGRCGAQVTPPGTVEMQTCPWVSSAKLPSSTIFGVWYGFF